MLHHSPDLPWGGDWHGHDGFAGWAERMSAFNESLEVREPRLLADGGTVLVDLTLVVRARSSGTVVDAPMVQLVRVDDDLIVDFRAYYWNVPAYLRAYGL